MLVHLADKKKFLQWLVTSVAFDKREILWILDYLIRHETILNQVHFVEHVEKTNRGLRIASQEENALPMQLFLQGQTFTDAEQIFHEMRMNWREALYIECLFPTAWTTSEYLAVLEDNPFAPWNEQVDPALIQKIDAYFQQEARNHQLMLLHHQIDQALEASDYDAFLELSDELNRLML